MRILGRYPKFFIAVFAIFALGGFLLAIDALAAPFDAALFLKGAISVGVGLMMISYTRQAAKDRIVDR